MEIMREHVDAESTDRPRRAARHALRKARIEWYLAWIGPALSLFLSYLWPPASGAYTVLTWGPINLSSNVYALGLFGLSVVLLVGAYAAQNQTYKRHWQGTAVTPRGFRQANLTWLKYYELSELACFWAFVDANHFGWYGGLMLGSAVLLIAHYPTGQPMQPRSPRLGTPER